MRERSAANMAPESEPELKLEIAHVLTIDVVAYSTLLIHEQSRVMAELNRVVRKTPCFCNAEKADRLTRLPTGDGMALVFFTDSEAPLECAMQISAELKSQPEIQIRMGVHSGPVNQILDVNDRSNVAGAGIDMAQRVMDCGDAGHILVSKRVADDLAPYSRWNQHLHDLGECVVKHGRKISVFNFYTDTVGNPDPPQKMGALRTKRPRIPIRRGFLTAMAAVGVIVSLGFAAWFLRQTDSGRRAIAVLPFLDLSQAGDQEYFSDGVTEQIINSLARIRGLFVVARSSSFVFKNKSTDVREIGKALAVTHVLEGSVSRDSGRVRVDTQLIDVSNGYQLWAESYNFTAQDALALQSDVAKKVARALEVHLRLNEKTALASLATHDPEANDLYLRGRYLLNKRTPDSIGKGRELFEEAVAKDPHFALGRVGIADACILLGKVGAIPGPEAASLARAEVTAALAIDDQLADAYTSRAVIRADFEWDWTAAESDFRKALKLNANNAAAHHWYGRHLAQFGRFEPALLETEAALKNDPLSPTVWVSKAKILFVARRYEEAIGPCLKALELEPGFASAFSILGQAYAHLGDHSKAISAAEKYVELSRDTGWARLELAYAQVLAGDVAKAEAIVQGVQLHPSQFSAYDMATICSARHDEVGGLTWLERAISQRTVDVVWIRVDPRLDNIRGNPGFPKVIQRMEPQVRAVPEK